MCVCACTCVFHLKVFFVLVVYISTRQKVSENLWLSKEAEWKSHYILNKVALGHAPLPLKGNIVLSSMSASVVSLSYILLYGMLALCVWVIIKKENTYIIVQQHVISFPREPKPILCLKVIQWMKLWKPICQRTAWFLFVFKPQIHCLPSPSH